MAPPPGIDPAMYEQALAYLRQNPEAALQAQEQMRRMGSPAMAQAASRQMQDPDYRCGNLFPRHLPHPIPAHPAPGSAWVDARLEISRSDYQRDTHRNSYAPRLVHPPIAHESEDVWIIVLPDVAPPHSATKPDMGMDRLWRRGRMRFIANAAATSQQCTRLGLFRPRLHRPPAFPACVHARPVRGFLQRTFT